MLAAQDVYIAKLTPIDLYGTVYLLGSEGVIAEDGDAIFVC
jgi:hypothetical protein